MRQLEMRINRSNRTIHQLQIKRRQKMWHCRVQQRGTKVLQLRRNHSILV
jgi:hypothetical protein